MLKCLKIIKNAVQTVYRNICYLCKQTPTAAIHLHIQQYVLLVLWLCHRG
jgi:hypothetical protein